MSAQTQYTLVVLPAGEYPCLVLLAIVVSLVKQPQLFVPCDARFNCPAVTTEKLPHKHAHRHFFTLLGPAGSTATICSRPNTCPAATLFLPLCPSVFIGVIGKGHAQPLASISSTEGTRVLVEGVFKAEGSPMDWGVWVDEGSGRRGI